MIKLNGSQDGASTIFIWRLRPCVIAKVATRSRLGLRDQIITFRTPTSRALWRAETLLTKEPATIAWIDTFERDDIFWDVGANIGIYSLYAAKVKAVATLAFEPAAFNYALLCDNIRLNGLEDGIAAYAIAFYRQPGLGELTVADDEPGAAVASIDDPGVGRLKQAALIFSVDDFIGRFEPPFPTHIKDRRGRRGG